MRRKKKRRTTHHRTHHHHRGRYGAVAGFDVGAVLVALGTGILTRFLAGIIKIDPRISGVVTLILGGVLIPVRNSLVSGAGFGALVSGGITASQSFGLIHGVGAPIIYRREGRSVRGPNDVKNMGTTARYPQPGNLGRATRRRSVYAGVYG